MQVREEYNTFLVRVPVTISINRTRFETICSVFIIEKALIWGSGFEGLFSKNLNLTFVKVQGVWNERISIINHALNFDLMMLW